MDNPELLTMAPLVFFMIFVGVYPAPMLALLGAATRVLLVRM
jgi:NADH:ubiquinone oxidoreductase subunit 4 (subunit M)